jgi:hypothetical protein
MHWRAKFSTSRQTGHDRWTVSRTGGAIPDWLKARARGLVAGLGLQDGNREIERVTEHLFGTLLFFAVRLAAGGADEPLTFHRFNRQSSIILQSAC